MVFSVLEIKIKNSRWKVCLTAAKLSVMREDTAKYPSKLHSCYCDQVKPKYDYALIAVLPTYSSKQIDFLLGLHFMTILQT